MVRHFVLGTLFAVLVSCNSEPPPSALLASGEIFTHSEASFSLQVPAGWKASPSRIGLTLTREVPFGGGFPTLSVRRVDAAEAETLTFEGSHLKRKTSELDYRYRRWSNSRGRGYRLEVLQKSSSGALFIDASMWDAASRIDAQFFNEQFWPIINSLDDSN